MENMSYLIAWYYLLRPRWMRIDAWLLVATCEVPYARGLMFDLLLLVVGSHMEEDWCLITCCLLLAWSKMEGNWCLIVCCCLWSPKWKRIDVCWNQIQQNQIFNSISSQISILLFLVSCWASCNKPNGTLDLHLLFHIDVIHVVKDLMCIL